MQKTQLEHKSRFGPWSAQNDGAMTLSGYASVKGVVDAQGDMVETGAYRGLAEFLAEGFVAVGHQTSGLPIGFVTEAREDERGLFVAMTFHSTPEGTAAWTVAKERTEAGKRVGLSIGYVPVSWRFESKAGRRVRVLERIELKEFSLVTMPDSGRSGNVGRTTLVGQ